ncbi:MAG: acetyl-CoA carboxylase biotin carboxylase subunit, partial [Candidatus Eisenbacteria bacterium]|nr:acetyl-CoA carboxylase biotin carboxylase subunit [Candidatus Eisenbacteria bacterium]
MFKKILIANRGEIAVRVIRACHELGIQAVAVYSEADRDSMHVRLADESVCIGPAISSESYLNVPRIISAAQVMGADAIHPGYGFLSENAHFAEVCESCQITFIGPTSDQIRSMGDKSNARDTMKAAGVPVVPGSDGIVATPEEGLKWAEKIGYPVIVKALAGGGGKGMRVATSPEELEKQFTAASQEALAGFGNGDMYMERYLAAPRHIEVQLMGDSTGNVIHLGERDCSIQRRHQKLIEEAPSPVITPELRQQIGEAACAGAAAIGYCGAGTMEFLYEDGEFFFMEMNTRLQVEHPVTELVTGVDLVVEQIRVAAGEPLSIHQRDIELIGHSIECRINAEDPDLNFRPSPGTIDFLHFPGGPGVRVDSHLYQGYRIPPNYDSMIAKIIVHAPTRADAI